MGEPQATVLVGNVQKVLGQLEDGSVDCVVTSPPYWGLRDYGTGEWVGGDPGCEHVGSERWYTEQTAGVQAADAFSEPGDANVERLKAGRWREAGVCSKCGSEWTDEQLGLERTWEEYTEKLVVAFREVWRVLSPTGTVWLNLGDSYASGNREGHGTRIGVKQGTNRASANGSDSKRPPQPAGVKHKELVGIPWKVAFALQADGWYLRSDIIWAKPNPMPESVTDRPTKSHEYVFMLTKQQRYFFDQEAVKEPHTSSRWGGAVVRQPDTSKYATGAAGAAGALSAPGREWDAFPEGGRNVRTVWEIATRPYPGAHFATMPPELAERCIAAGCPDLVCVKCGKPRLRIVSREPNPQGINGGEHREPVRNGALGPRKRDAVREARIGETGTIGWSDCGHDSWRRGLVLDPFLGSGTTAVAALRLGRDAVGVELKPEYAELAEQRIARWWTEPARIVAVDEAQEALFEV